MIAVFLLMFISSLSLVNQTSRDDLSFRASVKKSACTEDDAAKINDLCSVHVKTFFTTCQKCRESSRSFSWEPFEKEIANCLVDGLGISDKCGKKRLIGKKACSIPCSNSCYYSFC